MKSYKEKFDDNEMSVGEMAMIIQMWYDPLQDENQYATWERIKDWKEVYCETHSKRN